MAAFPREGLKLIMRFLNFNIARGYQAAYPLEGLKLSVLPGSRTCTLAGYQAAYPLEGLKRDEQEHKLCLLHEAPRPRSRVRA